jgi:hypothetical protein
MRQLAAAAICAGFVALAHAADRIDLNAPGAMETLARDNPAHYEKVRRILAEVERRPLASVAGWMKTEFAAENVVYSGMVRTSDPAKKLLAFTLDRTRYEGVVTLAQTEKRVPAR